MFFSLRDVSTDSGALSLGVKWSKREANGSFPSDEECENAWSYTFAFRDAVLN
jgi:hypothetical protein